MGAQAVRLSNIDIDQALSNRDFEVLFQPIFDLGNGALSRMETFVRWRHASLGVLPPGAFISFFESQGRMSELSRYVLDEAMTHYLKWRGNYGPGFSINLALSDLNDEAIASHLTVLLREHDFPADAVTLECPMPPVTMDSDHALEQFESLRKTGARLAIEVRGRANEFLRNVEPFPFDEIKTGGAAILRFARTVRGPGLSAISELLDIANNSNASITAVGVEDQASLSALRGLGFSAAQGNHLSKVGDLTDFRPVMVNHVRQLLDLDDLSSAELSDLFRTGKPTPFLPSQPQAEHSLKENEATQETLTPEVSSEVSKKKPISTVERARRKAAILAKKKGKNALRNELEKRRSKLGLSVPLIDNEPSPSAAKELQNLLSDNFEDQNSDFQNSDFNDANNSLTEENNIAPSQERTSEQSPSPSPDDTKRDTAEDNQIPESTINKIDSLAAQTTKKEIDQHKPEMQSQNNTSSLKPAVNLAKIGNEPLDGRVAHVTKKDTTTDALNNNDLHSSPASNSVQEKSSVSASQVAKKPFQVKSQSTKIGASFSNIYIAPTNQIETTVSPEPQSFVSIDNDEIYDPEIERRRKIEDSLVLFSLGDDQPTKPRPAPKPSTDILAATLTPPLHIPPDTNTAAQDYETLPTQSEPSHGTTEDEATLNDPVLDFDNLEIEDTEASMIAQSASIDLTARQQKNRRARSETFLTRRYNLWPDHFWPKSWVRAWSRAQANKEFVRKAKLAADKLNNPDSEPRDSLF